MQVSSRPTVLVDAPEGAGSWLRRWAGSYDVCDGSFFEVAGFPPAAYEKLTDAIPHQSVFEAGVCSFLTAIAAAEDRGLHRISLIVSLFQYLLQPEFGAFHRRYDEWRATIHAKCYEFSADPRSTRRLRALCRTFRRLFPA